MKNIIKTNKRGIIAILTLCMLLNTIGICVYATVMPEENSAVTEETTVVVEETVVATEEPIIATEENVVVTDENTQELMPMTANSCSSNYSLFGPDGRIYANVHFDHSHGGMQPHVHVYTWHQGPNGNWNSSHSCKPYDPELYPRP